LKDSGAIALVTHSTLLQTALEAIKEIPSIFKNRVYLIDGQHHETQRTVEELIQIGREMKTSLAPLKMKRGEAKEKLAFVSYSSGTTGLPKGVMISHYNVISNVLQVALHEKEANDKKRDITMCLLPLYHIYGTLSLKL
jgi:long-subunit acyl-CoA synthetase (AMP-forming)